MNTIYQFLKLNRIIPIIVLVGFIEAFGWTIVIGLIHVAIFGPHHSNTDDVMLIGLIILYILTCIRMWFFDTANLSMFSCKADFMCQKPHILIRNQSYLMDPLNIWLTENAIKYKRYAFYYSSTHITDYIYHISKQDLVLYKIMSV